MKILCLIVLFTSSPCFAQTLSNFMMPDGSRDTYVGLVLISKPVAEGNTASRETVLFPQLQVQWSNGVFVSGLNTLGMHLSDTPGVEYGPVLHWQQGRGVENRQSLAGTDAIKSSPNVGGFFNYYLGQSLRLTSELVATTDAPGTLLAIGIQKRLPTLAPHHTVSLSAGATFADAAYARHYYGVTGDTANGSAMQSYVPAGGLLNLHAGFNWNWTLSASWLLSTSMEATYYAATAADSPVNNSRSAVVIGSGLGYRF